MTRFNDSLGFSGREAGRRRLIRSANSHSRVVTRGHEEWVGRSDRDLLKKVIAIKPKVHVCGHIHESYGMVKRSGTKFINACILNESYELFNRPLTFEI